MPKSDNSNRVASIAAGVFIFAIIIAAGYFFYNLSQNKAFTASGNFDVTNPTAAPEITGISQWVNSNGEKISDLKGKVVLVDFWTYSCINCIRSLTYLNEWYTKYHDDGLVIIGIHTPEFSFEHNFDNVKKAVADFGIQYPVGLDNDMATWNAFGNQYWPAEYLIDKNGLLRNTHFGEGDYSGSEKLIQTLLSEGTTQKFDTTNIDTSGDTPPIVPNQTPETYLGFSRAENVANADQIMQNVPTDYTFNDTLAPDYWTIQGNWEVDDEQIVAQKDNAQLRLNFSAKEVYLVMSSPNPAAVDVKVDGQEIAGTGLKGDDVGNDSKIQVSDAKLYRIVKSPQFINGSTLELTFPKGVVLNAFTFGG